MLMVITPITNLLIFTLLCLIVGGGGGWIKCTRGKLSRFLKMGRGGGGGLGRSLIMIKWTWGFFSQNLQFDPPLPSPLQVDTREYKKNNWILQNYIKLIINHYANQPLSNIALIYCNPIMLFNNADCNTVRPKFPVHIFCKF